MVLKPDENGKKHYKSFRSLQTYMVLKLNGSEVLISGRFRSLQTYMVLKHTVYHWAKDHRFRSLQTYMVLKRTFVQAMLLSVLDPYKLTWFSNERFGVSVYTVVLDPYKLTWFSNLKFKNFTVLTELLHTDICCKPIFLIPRCLFYHLKLNQAILLIQYMIIFTVQPFFL